jgi:hypothetical protein
MRGTTIPLAIAVLVISLAAACKGGGPTTPTGTPPPSSGETFEVTGIVTDEQGAPVAGAAATMAYWLDGRVRRPSVLTDALGSYTIEFTSNPWTSTNGRGAARAEVGAEGYDWYWRTVLATSPRLVENFRLLRIKRITAGDSIVLSVTPDNGECLGWLYGPCGRIRVAAVADGNLTIDANLTGQPESLPQLEVCCTSGNERYGNPVTLPVIAGTEVSVEVGQRAAGVITSQAVIVKTSLQPF